MCLAKLVKSSTKVQRSFNTVGLDTCLEDHHQQVEYYSCLHEALDLEQTVPFFYLGT